MKLIFIRVCFSVSFTAIMKVRSSASGVLHAIHQSTAHLGDALRTCPQVEDMLRYIMILNIYIYIKYYIHVYP